ncbi:MAG: hypothetical protein ACOYNC_17500 [Bacteroidales bacterium]
MRKSAQEGKPFSFVHATYNRDNDSCDGVRYVKSALLRPAAKGDDLVHAEFKLFYFDEDIQKPRVCWQPLIMYLGSKKVILN